MTWKLPVEISRKSVHNWQRNGWKAYATELPKWMWPRVGYRAILIFRFLPSFKVRAVHAKDFTDLTRVTCSMSFHLCLLHQHKLITSQMIFWLVTYLLLPATCGLLPRSLAQGHVCRGGGGVTSVIFIIERQPWHSYRILQTTDVFCLWVII